MASTNSSSNIQSENIPQWKKDLIQRRRQQTKVLANNGASVKLCTAVIGGSGGAETFDNGLTSLSSQECVGGSGNGGGKSRTFTTNESHCVGLFARHSGGTTSASASATDGGSDHFKPQHTVAGNMRLETDVLCSDSDYGLNSVNKMDDKSESRNVVAKLKSAKSDMESSKCNDIAPSDDGESDSSEELQYGPGIVNRLKSKYLNLTLREMNKTRQNAQNFRRATSLEDLLDCDDDPADKSHRKYAKRNAPGVSAKSERYRNVSRGNDSIKRARSVETLLRYNSTSDDVTPHIVPSRFTAGIPSHEPPNDHIILIDRTSVKIESKLLDPDRPKALNKPRRVKLVVDETERPPLDLVKTTMRIFEGSTKKLKPKGEVAAKVATFKTINDTFKAQNQKKIIPKPPLQPKPFTNGIKAPSSPKKITNSIPTVERLEHPECLHNDGVITDPIVQSVSSVVSKFQQIEKSQSPSPSPEPLCKLKSSPIPSPEPPINKLKLSPDPKVKSPPSTPEPRPLPAPRISSPRILSPSTDKKEIFGLNSSLSPSLEIPAQESGSQDVVETDADVPKPSTDNSGQKIPGRFESPDLRRKETPRSSSPIEADREEREVADGAKSISKTALENIAKAGTTVQFSFNNKIDTSKSYLPGVAQNGQRIEESITEPVNKSDSIDGSAVSSLGIKSPGVSVTNKSFPGGDVDMALETPMDSLESSTNFEDKLNESTGNGDANISGENGDTEEVVKIEAKIPVDHKPIGAISSLGLMKSMNTTSTTTATSYAQCNETKIIKTQKTETPSPPQKQIGIIRPLVSTKTQVPQQNLSNREMEKNLINRVKSIEQPTKVVVSLKSSAEEIQPVKKTNNSGGGGGGGGLWDTKPWNDQNNTMVFNFSNRKEVPDYIENDGLRVRRKRAKPKAGDGGIIVLDATLDASTTDDAEWEMTGGPPSPCNVSFLNDNILINGRSNLSKQPRNHKHRIQFDDTATRTFEYPSEVSMLVGESSHVGVESSVDRTNTAVRDAVENRPPSVSPTPGIPSLLGGGGLASYTPSKVDLASEGFELGVTRASPSTTAILRVEQPESLSAVDYLKPAQDGGAWGSETTADLLF